VPPRHLKSHAISVAFPAWLLGHEPSKQILSVTYAQDLSETLARNCRSVITSPFYQALFETRLSREAVADFDREAGAIIIVMQRLHADDLVAFVQEKAQWDVLAFPAIAEQDESYSFVTPYGRRQAQRKPGDILQPALVSRESLDEQRHGMNDYNFFAQYQQNPQPPSGIIVKREWLKYYRPDEKPERFDQILQSWDTANKDSELANFSVCTTWGIKDRLLFLLDVFRQKLEFPDLKRAIVERAKSYRAKVVLIEDMASGTATAAARLLWLKTHPLPGGVRAVGAKLPNKPNLMSSR
jgi:hypothetical protein